MRHTGFHVSISGGLHKAFDNAAPLGIDTFQIFLKNSTRWIVPSLSAQEVLSFEETVILSRPATKIDNIREDGSYNRVILIPERLLWISITGDKDKFGEYEEIIRGIEVLEVDEGIQAPYLEEPEVLG